jgi:hypothetical protein
MPKDAPPNGGATGDQQDQPDPARLDELLPARRLQAHLESAPLLRELASDQVASQTAPLEVEPVPPPIHHSQRGMAPIRSRRSDLDQPSRSNCQPLPIPGREDPQPLPAKDTSEQLTVESRVRREAHARFGERPGETDRQ